MPGGHHRFLGYVIDVAGLRIVHLGDTVPFEGLAERIRSHRPRLALFPVNGRSVELLAGGVPGNLTLDQAAALCRACQIPAMIAHHYGMFSFNTIAADAIDRRAAETADSLLLVHARTGIEYVPEPFDGTAPAGPDQP